MLKKLGSIAVVASMLTGTIAPQVGAVASAAAVPAAVAAIGLATVLAPSTAHAQSGSRVCAMRFRGGGATVWMYMEVSKYDPVTCPASVAAFETIMGTRSIIGWLNNAVSYQAFGSLRYNKTCESFTSELGWYNRDICHQTERYKLYAIGLYNGFRGLKRV